MLRLRRVAHVTMSISKTGVSLASPMEFGLRYNGSLTETVIGTALCLRLRHVAHVTMSISKTGVSLASPMEFGLRYNGSLTETVTGTALCCG